MIINLDSSQSKKLADKKELILIEPMEVQPVICGKNEDGFYYNEGVYNRDNICDMFDLAHDMLVDCKYKVGQEIKIRQEWAYDPSSGKPKIACGKRCIPTSHLPETMPKELWQTVIIDILGPKKVQDIDYNLLSDYMFKYHSRKVDSFKNYFNKKYNEPKPVECDECWRHGVRLDNTNNEVCSKCNGNSISHYQAFTYDNALPVGLLNLLDEVQFPKGKDFYGEGCTFYKGKELEIIVDPFCEIIRIASE